MSVTKDTQNNSDMAQGLEFVKAFILINVVWTSDKICILISDFLSISNLQSFLIEFQMIVNIFVSLLIGTLTIVKIYQAVRRKDKEEKNSHIGEDEEN